MNIAIYGMDENIKQYQLKNEKRNINQLQQKIKPYTKSKTPTSYIKNVILEKQTNKNPHAVRTLQKHSSRVRD